MQCPLGTQKKGMGPRLAEWVPVEEGSESTGHSSYTSSGLWKFSFSSSLSCGLVVLGTLGCWATEGKEAVACLLRAICLPRLSYIGRELFWAVAPRC